MRRRRLVAEAQTKLRARIRGMAFIDRCSAEEEAVATAGRKAGKKGSRKAKRGGGAGDGFLTRVLLTVVSSSADIEVYDPVVLASRGSDAADEALVLRRAGGVDGRAPRVTCVVGTVSTSAVAADATVFTGSKSAEEVAAGQKELQKQRKQRKRKAEAEKIERRKARRMATLERMHATQDLKRASQAAANMSAAMEAGGAL